MRSLLAVAFVLAGLGLTGCGAVTRAAAIEPASQTGIAAAPVTYPSVGVTLVAVRPGYRPAVSRSAVQRLLRASHLSPGVGRPLISLQAVKDTDAPGGAYPAWVFTYRHTPPASYGLPDTTDCTSVAIYNLSTRAWTWHFQSCREGKDVSPSCDSGCTPANQDMLDAAADAARKIAGAYYTGVVVNDATNSDTVYLAHAPQAVVDALNTAHPGLYAIENDAPRPLSAVMRLMRSFNIDALSGDGITISGFGPTQDGYLQVGVTAHVADAQAKLDAIYGAGIIKVVQEEMAMPVDATGPVRQHRSSH